MRITITAEEDEYGNEQILINGKNHFIEDFDELAQTIGEMIKNELARIGHEGVVIEVNKEKINV